MPSNKCCSVGVCRSQSKVNKDVMFFRFPNKIKEPKKCNRWVTACGRTNFSVEDVTRFIYVCSKHFVDGKPTVTNPDPIPVTKNCQQELKQNPFADNSQDDFITLNSSESDTEVSGETKKNKSTTAPFHRSGPSTGTSEFGNMSESSCLGLSQQLRKLSVGNVNKFLENWTPESSTRETRKLTRKIYTQSPKARNRYYDENGFLMKTGKDVCDCLEDDCPGCHFPCPKCSSPKCGHECRVYRRWAYDSVEIEGREEATKNKYK